MRIVVPTDFSECSIKSIEFAVAFIRQVGGELILLHVLPNLGPTLGTLPTITIKKDMLQWVENEFEKLTARIRSGELNVTQQIAYGPDVESALQSFINVQDADLIVMGSRGASGLKRMLLGSNAVDVINHASIPVLVVPESATVGPIIRLLYASDFKHLNEEVLRLVPYARLLHTAIRVIHVPPLQYLERIDTDRLLDNLKEAAGFSDIGIKLLEGDDVAASIEQYAEESRGELLVLFTHRAGFLEQLFHKSIAREIAWHHTIPLLVINRP